MSRAVVQSISSGAQPTLPRWRTDVASRACPMAGRGPSARPRSPPDSLLSMKCRGAVGTSTLTAQVITWCSMAPSSRPPVDGLVQGFGCGSVPSLPGTELLLELRSTASSARPLPPGSAPSPTSLKPGVRSSKASHGCGVIRITRDGLHESSAPVGVWHRCRSWAVPI